MAGGAACNGGCVVGYGWEDPGPPPESSEDLEPLPEQIYLFVAICPDLISCIHVGVRKG